MTVTAWLVVALLVSSPAPSQSSSAEQCPSYDTLEEVVYLAYPHNCSLFRRCQAGQPVLGHCPPGQHFNPGTKVCDDPTRAGCTAAPEPCSAGQPQTTCRYKCSCSRKGDNATCPARLQFSPVLEVLDGAGGSCPREPGDFDLGGGKVGRLTATNATGNASSCPSRPSSGGATTTTTAATPVNVPHFADCSKMVVCAADGSEQEHACPPGQLYDASVGLCDAPEFVDCPAAAAAARTGGLVTGGCPPAGTDPPGCEHACACAIDGGASGVGGCPASIGFSAAADVFGADEHPECAQEPGSVALGGGLVARLSVRPNTTRASRCPPGGPAGGRVYLPDPADCGRVTLCTMAGERILSCPAGLHFDPRSRSCKPPKQAACAARPPPRPTPPPATPATPASTSSVARDDLSCPTTWACPASSSSSSSSVGTRSRRSSANVPHLSDCTMFCRCTGHGVPLLGACPPGRHFSARSQTCVPPAKAKCRPSCPQISADVRGTWTPANCTSQDSREGANCSLTCGTGFQLIGSESINCTSRGWYGSGGLNHIPSCNTPDEWAEAVDRKLNETLTRLGDDKAGVIFVLDESLSVDPRFYFDSKSENFEAQKDLAGCVVQGFPLSEDRSAGVITFSTDAHVDIDLGQTSTCDFVSQLRGITFFGGNTDLAAALLLAGAEINNTSPPRKTLVLIVTDGQSQTDPAPAAAHLRDAGHVVFSIAVADYDRQQLEPISSTHTDGSKLFFALPNFELFRHIEYYLRAKYNQNSSIQCP